MSANTDTKGDADAWVMTGHGDKFGGENLLLLIRRVRSGMAVSHTAILRVKLDSAANASNEQQQGPAMNSPFTGVGNTGLRAPNGESSNSTESITSSDESADLDPDLENPETSDDTTGTGEEPERSTMGRAITILAVSALFVILAIAVVAFGVASIAMHDAGFAITSLGALILFFGLRLIYPALERAAPQFFEV